MSEFSDSQNTLHKKRIITSYLAFAALWGIFSLVSILQIPTESASAIFFGLSGPRLVLFLGVLGLIIFMIALLFKTTTDKSWYESFQGKVDARLADNKFTSLILGISILTIIWGANFNIQIPGLQEPVALAYYLRLQPLVLLAVFLAVQNLPAVYLYRHGVNLHPVKKGGHRIYTYFVVSGLILIITIWAAGTGYGLKSIDEGIGWHPLGTPLLFSQLLLALSITLGFLLLWVRSGAGDAFTSMGKNIRLDGAVCLVLWLAAFGLWMAQPLKANWFASEPRPPNFQFYPSSDASVYDITAINLSLGAGFMTRGSPFTLRPLYAAFLAGLHQLAGPGYESIIWIQVLFLALIPVFLYLLTKQIHNRTSALLVSFLFIFRETNALRLADSISDAHAKLLMPFLPATLGILIFLWLLVRWLQNPHGQPWTPLVAGGIMGLFMLVRPEIAVILPFIAMAAFFQLRKRGQLWFRGMSLLVVGLVLALVPWIWRNYQLTGTIFLDSPHYRLDLINKRYREEPIGFTLPETPSPADTIQEPLPESISDAAPESASPGTPAVTPDVNGIVTPASEAAANLPGEGEIQASTEGFAAEILKFIEKNPLGTLNFITNHFMNSVVQTVLALPSSYPMTYSTVKFLGHQSPSNFWLDCCSLVDYERRFPFWPKWDGILPRNAYVPFALSLFFISVGIGASWRKGKFMGLIPLFSAFGYYLVNALGRNSGGRYIIPMNWVGFFYFSIGLIHLTLYAFSSFTLRLRQGISPAAQPDQQKTDRLQGTTSPSIKNAIAISLSILAIGATIPLLEAVIPQKYDQDAMNAKVQVVFQGNQRPLTPTETQALDHFLSNGGLIFQGKALYPRFHKPYEMGSVWRIYYERPYAHIDFYLSAPADRGVVLPLVESPEYFPHASDILVFGCDQEEDVQAFAIILFSEDGGVEEIFWRSPAPEMPSCPLPVSD